jgi:glycosyltransferase involved in cell wall biosynthesis
MRPRDRSCLCHEPILFVTTLPRTVPRHSDITVVIPCFNHGEFLPEAVDSALRQDGGPPNVIVIDDGSTDEVTLRAMEELPKEVDLIRQANAGLANSRNAAFERSDSEMLLMVDADDRLTPDALDTLRPPLEANPDLGYCYGLMRMFGAWSGVVRFPDFDPYILLHRSITGANLGLIRRACWKDVGGFDPEMDAIGYEDWDFALSALEKGWLGLQISKVTKEHRKHDHSMQEEKRRRYREFYRQLRRKHAALFDRRSEFAKESRLNPPQRLLYRTFWAWRPVPAGLEGFLYSKVVFRKRATAE